MVLRNKDKQIGEGPSSLSWPTNHLPHVPSVCRVLECVPVGLAFTLQSILGLDRLVYYSVDCSYYGQSFYKAPNLPYGLMVHKTLFLMKVYPEREWPESALVHTCKPCTRQVRRRHSKPACATGGPASHKTKRRSKFCCCIYHLRKIKTKFP